MMLFVEALVLTAGTVIDAGGIVRAAGEVIGAAHAQSVGAATVVAGGKGAAAVVTGADCSVRARHHHPV